MSVYMNNVFFDIMFLLSLRKKTIFMLTLTSLGW